MTFNWKIRFNAPVTFGNELKYIRETIDNSHWSGNNDFTHKCQDWLEKKLGCTQALMTHSCTGALELAAILSNVGVGDEVIMPSFTFVSTASAFVLRGATPVFVDIRPHDLNIDTERIATAITSRTKAIVPVHYGSRPCDMDRINQIAHQHGLLVIEDSAQGLLSSYKGRYLGTLGHLGCLSFHETKNITCGEGGALLINDPEMIQRARIVWEKGTNRLDFRSGQIKEYTWMDLGSSFYPNELTCAFLYGQLERSQDVITRRLAICKRYDQNLKRLETRGLVTLGAHDANGESNGHIFYILTKTEDDRTALIQFLKERRILAVSHYVPLHDSPAGKRYGRVHGDMTVTDALSRRLVRLPLHYLLSDADVDEVSDAVRCFYDGRGGEIHEAT